MADQIRIAQVRVYPVKGDLDTNFSILLDILDRIAAGRPDIVITPEGFLDGYISTEAHITRRTLRRYAIDPQASPYVDVIGAWAADHDAWVVFGCTRQLPRGVANSALIFDRVGRLVGAYDKTHLQSHDHKYVSGDSLPVFGSDFGPFGVLICADRRWPESVRTLALGGARIIFNPTYGMHDVRNLHMMQTRSYESEVVIAFTHPGQSLITGPGGQVLCNEEASTSDFSLCDVDLSKVDEQRAGQSHLRDRRADLYV